MIPVYSGNVGADVLVFAVMTQNQTEFWQDRKGHKEWTGIRVVSKVPQGCCQLQGSKVRQRDKKGEREATVCVSEEKSAHILP